MSSRKVIRDLSYRHPHFHTELYRRKALRRATIKSHIWRLFQHRLTKRYEHADRIKRRLGLLEVRVEIGKDEILFWMPGEVIPDGFRNLGEPNLH